MKNAKNNFKLSLIASSIMLASSAFSANVGQDGKGIFVNDLQNSQYNLSVRTPDGAVHKFIVNGEDFAINAKLLGVRSMADGLYKYELSPIVKAGNLANDVRALADDSVSREYADTFKSPFQKTTGVFSLSQGRLIRDEEEAVETPEIKATNTTQETPVTRAQVFVQDLVVQGSICAGLDCVNGESFGFDTLRLKENNLRIKFQDTSVSASFPSNDWQLVANDTGNGGANRFSIEDVDGGRTPFTVEASAPNHSLYIDDGGRIGIGTNTPVVELHIPNGDTPTLRLEQDGTSGFTPQTWDVAGNETNFFVRDATNGSKLPFKIVPNAPTNSLFIDSDGDIGLGDASPDAALDVERNNGTARIMVTENSGDLQDRALISLTNKGGSRIDFNNTNTGANSNNWRVATEDLTGSFIITKVGSGDKEFEITTEGNIELKGVLVHTSDVNMKKNIVEVNADEILEKVSQLPIATWQYKDQTSDITHMGPMAQDFRAAFGLGINDTSISDTDITGVALASIKALQAKLAKRDQEIEKLHQNNDQLEKRLFNLEAQLLGKDKIVVLK